MKVEALQFGSIVIDGKRYTEDIIIDNGKIELRNKDSSRKYKSRYGHTPLTVNENIPWECNRLIIGAGMYGSLPVMDEVKLEAEKRDVELVIISTSEAVKKINSADTNFILHLTC